MTVEPTEFAVAGGNDPGNNIEVLEEFQFCFNPTVCRQCTHLPPDGVCPNGRVLCGYFGEETDPPPTPEGCLGYCPLPGSK